MEIPKRLRKNTVVIDLSKTNWKQLRNQKVDLIKCQEYMSTGLIPGECWAESLEGILNWMDDIQDQAAEQIGELKVFGRLK